MLFEVVLLEGASIDEAFAFDSKALLGVAAAIGCRGSVTFARSLLREPAWLGQQDVSHYSAKCNYKRAHYHGEVRNSENLIKP